MLREDEKRLIVEPVGFFKEEKKRCYAEGWLRRRWFFFRELCIKAYRRKEVGYIDEMHKMKKECKGRLLLCAIIYDEGKKLRKKKKLLCLKIDTTRGVIRSRRSVGGRSFSGTENPASLVAVLLSLYPRL